MLLWLVLFLLLLLWWWSLLSLLLLFRLIILSTIVELDEETSSVEGLAVAVVVAQLRCRSRPVGSLLMCIDQQ